MSDKTVENTQIEQEPAALNTPPLTTMDSDDDYNSGMSSQGDGFEDQLQDSGEDSLEEGMYHNSLWHTVSVMLISMLHSQISKMTSQIWDSPMIKT